MNEIEWPVIIYTWFLSIVFTYGAGHLIGDYRTKKELSYKLDNCHAILREGKK